MFLIEYSDGSPNVRKNPLRRRKSLYSRYSVKVAFANSDFTRASELDGL